MSIYRVKSISRSKHFAYVLQISFYRQIYIYICIIFILKNLYLHLSSKVLWCKYRIVYMCVCLHVYTYIHISIYVCVHIHFFIYLHVCTCACPWLCFQSHLAPKKKGPRNPWRLAGTHTDWNGQLGMAWDTGI